HRQSNNLRDCCLLLADSAPGIQRRAFRLEVPLSDFLILPWLAGLPRLAYNSDGRSFEPDPRPSGIPEYPWSDRLRAVPLQDDPATGTRKNRQDLTVPWYPP